jgi:hypothetical protein
MLALKTLVPQPKTIRKFITFPFLIIACVLPALSQKPQSDDNPAPKYDVHTETKIKGTIDEIKLLPFASRKDFTQLTLKSGNQTVYIYVCPKPFQDEMGISFAKGDEIAVTGFEYKQETSDMVLARELVKGTDTLMFRDDKGQPVWNPRTGK